jgi:LacI family transcriptional regulator
MVTINEQNGHFDGSVTIEHVAQVADVSVATVSRVLNGTQPVRPKTRDKVLRAAQSLGYVVNKQAQRLAGGRSNIIGLIVRELTTSYISEIVRGIDAELVEANFDLMLHTTHPRARSEAEYAIDLTRGLADGLLLSLPRNPGAYLQTLRNRKFPHVLIDHAGINDGSPSVSATNRKGGYDATKHLIELGHTRIGFITGTMDLGCSRQRLEGYRAALREARIPFDTTLVREGDFQQPVGYAIGKTLLEMKNRPTAIFASNDVMAFGVMEAARDCGMGVPDDLSIIGFDGIPQTANVNPPMTTVAQPLELMGREAVRMLLKCIRDGELCNDDVELPTTLIVRGSTAAPRRSNRKAHKSTNPANAGRQRR